MTYTNPRKQAGKVARQCSRIIPWNWHRAKANTGRPWTGYALKSAMTPRKPSLARAYAGSGSAYEHAQPHPAPHQYPHRLPRLWPGRREFRPYPAVCPAPPARRTCRPAPCPPHRRPHLDRLPHCHALGRYLPRHLAWPRTPWPPRPAHPRQPSLADGCALHDQRRAGRQLRRQSLTAHEPQHAPGHPRLRLYPERRLA